MPNEEYQILIRRTGAEARRLLIEGSPARDRKVLDSLLSDIADGELPQLLADLGGHDSDDLVRVPDRANEERNRPSVIFAYTIKGWRLPFAGDAMNHSSDAVGPTDRDAGDHLGVDGSRPWAPFDADSPEGRLCRERGSNTYS